MIKKCYSGRSGLEIFKFELNSKIQYSIYNISKETLFQKIIKTIKMLYNKIFKGEKLYDEINFSEKDFRELKEIINKF